MKRNTVQEESKVTDKCAGSPTPCNNRLFWAGIRQRIDK